MGTRLRSIALLLALSAACSTARGVRLDTGQGEPSEYRPPHPAKSVKVDADGFEQALAQWVLYVPLPVHAPQQGLLVRASYPSNGADARWQRLMSKSFGGFCKPGLRRDDCLSMLDDVMGLSVQHRAGGAPRHGPG